MKTTEKYDIIKDTDIDNSKTMEDIGTIAFGYNNGLEIVVSYNDPAMNQCYGMNEIRFIPTGITLNDGPVIDALNCYSQSGDVSLSVARGFFNDGVQVFGNTNSSTTLLCENGYLTFVNDDIDSIICETLAQNNLEDSINTAIILKTFFRLDCLQNEDLDQNVFVTISGKHSFLLKEVLDKMPANFENKRNNWIYRE